MIMRLLTSVTRKALLAFGYPQLETSHPELAVHQVGAIKVRMAPEIPACQFFYPVDNFDNDDDDDDDESVGCLGIKPNKNREFVPYYRKEAVEGLVEYLNGFGDGIMQILEEKAHPLQDTYGVDPAATISSSSSVAAAAAAVNNNNNNEKKFPLVLFSHGLSGNMEMYTQLCAQLASTGCVVVALEHQDGSASYSTKVVSSKDDGKTNTFVEEVIPYKKPAPNSEIPYSRQKVLDLRTPMLEQRVEELRKVYEYIKKNDADDDTDGASSKSVALQQLVRKIISVTDPSKLHLVGHSFGGATQLLATQKWMEESSMINASSMRIATPTTSSASADSYDVTTTTTATATVSTTATTAVAQSLQLPPPTPQSVTVLDAWNFGLSDKVLNKGIPASTVSTSDDENNYYPTIISVLSENWALTNPEREQTLQFLRNCQHSHCSTPPTTTTATTRSHPSNTKKTNVFSYYAKHSVHQSVSDSECYLPSVAAKKIQNRGLSEQRHQTINAVVREFVKQQTNANTNNDNNENGDDNILIPFPLQ